MKSINNISKGLILFVLAGILAFRVDGQVSYLEYYLDNDPGLGNGEEITFTSGSDVTVDFTVPLSGDSNGIHLLAMRAKDVNGLWSHTNHRVFFNIDQPAIPNLVQAEYYIDTDPGIGLGTALPITPSGSIMIETNLDLSGLDPGIHQIAVRAKNALGTWSHVHVKTFLLVESPDIPNISEVEYFIDNDPGIGLANSLTIIPDDSVMIDQNIDLASISPGIHQIGVRAKNGLGQWSQIKTAVFLAISSPEIANIETLEYYIGSDPGFGLATSVSITPNDSVMFSETLNLSSYNGGDIVYFSIRAKDSNGKWSQTYTHEIEVSDMMDQLITFTMIASKVYGDDVFTLEASSDSGLPVSIASSDANVISVSGSSATIVNAGETILTATQEGDVDYNPAVPVDQTVVVAKADLEVIADDKQKVYGDANPDLSITYTGFVNSEDASVLDVTPLPSTGADQTSDAGSYDITVSEEVDNNYNLIEVPGTLTIDQATLTALAKDKTKVYGEVNPDLTISYGGFVNGDILDDIDTAPQASTLVDESSDAGSYAIELSAGTDNNYTIVNTNGSLTVSQASLTVSAEDKAKTYGEANPELTLIYDGFVNGDVLADIDNAPNANTLATELSDVGTYAIDVENGSDNNYSFLAVSGELTINKASLSAMADDQSKIYGEDNPELSISYDGFVNGNSSADLDTPPAASVEADASSDVGEYEISLSSGEDNNYTILTTAGSLIIEKAELNITADDQTITEGDDIPELSVSVEGFVNGDTESDITMPDASTDATSESEAGDYEIVLSGGEASNYNLNLFNGTLSIEELVGLINDGTIAFDVYPNPVVERFRLSDNSLIVDKIEIFDTRGRLVKIFDEVQGPYEVGELTPGLFSIIIHSEEKIFIKKIIIE